MATTSKRAKAARKKVATTIDPRCLVFVREGRHVYSELIYIGKTAAEAAVFVEGFNYGLTFDHETQEAFCGVDERLDRFQDRLAARMGKAGDA